MNNTSYRLFVTILKLLGFVRNLGINWGNGRKLILCYHDVGNRKWEFSVTKTEFEKQMRYLVDNYLVVSVDEVLKNNKAKRDQVAITFDDGYKAVFNNAFPVMQKLGLVGTVFVVGKTDITNQTGYKAELMNDRELQSLKDAGWEIGWHSKSHKNLKLQGAGGLIEEIGNKTNPMRFFAYPFGSYDYSVSEFVKQAGYKHAFSVDGSNVNTGSFDISRITVSSGIVGNRFAGLVSPLGVFVNGLFTALWRTMDSFKNKNGDTSIVISSYDDVKNPHYAGGGARAIHELAKRISNNFKVKVVSWNHSGVQKELIDGVYYERIGFKSFNPKLAQIAFQFSLPFIALVQKFGLWIESFGPPLTTAFLPLIIKDKVIGVVHMLSSEEMERKYKLPFGLVEKIGLRTYSNIVATSAPLKSKIQKLAPKSCVEVISNGVDKISSPKGKRKKQILFLGRLEVEQKGLDLLIEGFKKFVATESGEGYKLVVAGNGTAAEFNKLKSLVRAADVRRSVIFAGRVEGKQKEKLFESSSCMVVSSRFETFGMVALEAMAYGLPVVAFDIDGLMWAPKDAVIKVPPFESGTLAQAIEEAVQKSKAMVLSKKGISFARKYTWDKIALKYEDYLKKVIYG